jgi:hypothetical protein
MAARGAAASAQRNEEHRVIEIEAVVTEILSESQVVDHTSASNPKTTSKALAIPCRSVPR